MYVQRPQSRTQQRRGALTVEFCMVVPIIFFLFLGSLEVTAVNIVRQSAGNAAYEAARKAVIPGGTASDAQTTAMQMLTILNAHRGATVTVTESLEKVSVSITVPAAQNSWGMSRFVSDINVTETCTLSRDKF
jgi:Flp pilus assembly protein TadG